MSLNEKQILEALATLATKPDDLFSPESSQAIDVLYETLELKDFDWLNWPKGEEFVQNPSIIADASKDDCHKLIFAILRSDRFNEGALQHAMDQGVFAAVLKRLSTL
jgi:hypothetical protein